MNRIPWHRLHHDILRVSPPSWRHCAYDLIPKRHPSDPCALDEQSIAISETSPPLTRVADASDYPDHFQVLPDLSSIDDAIYEGDLLSGETPPPGWNTDSKSPALFLQVNDHGNLTLLLRCPACRLVNPSPPLLDHPFPQLNDPDLSLELEPRPPSWNRLSAEFNDCEHPRTQAYTLRRLARRANLDVRYHDASVKPFPEESHERILFVERTEDDVSDAIAQQLGPSYTLHSDDTHLHIGLDRTALPHHKASEWPGHDAPTWQERVARHPAFVQQVPAYRIVWACV